MDPVTENLQIPYRRRPRKVIEVSLFGVDHYVSTENIQTSICVDEKNTIEVSRREVSELEAKARAYEHLASGHDSAVGVDVYEDGKESHLSDADWEVEKFYPSTERLLGRSIKAKSEVVPVESEVLAALEEALLIRYGHASEEHVKERSENLSVVDDSAMDRQSASGSVDESATQKSSTILTEDIVQQAAVEAKLGTDSGLDQVRTKYDDSTHSTLYDDTSNVGVSSSVEQSHPGVQLPSISGSVTDSSVAYEKSLTDATAVDETRSPISKDLERQALDDNHVSDNRESVMNVCDTEGVHPSTDEQKPGGRSGIPGESYADESQTLSTNRPTGSLEEVYLAQDDKKSIDHRGLGPDASKESSDEMSFLSTPGDRINLSVSSDQEERFQRAVGTDHDKTKYGEETLFAAENIEQVTDRPSFYDEDQEADRQKGDRMVLGNQNITRDSLDLQRHLGGIESLVKYPQEKDTSVSQDQKAAQFESSKMESVVLDDQESGGHGLLAFEEQSPADRGIISSKSTKEAFVTPQHQSETVSGEVPPKYMQGAFFGLDDPEEAGKDDRDGEKQPDKKQERKKRKKKGNLYTEEELKEGDVLQVTYTVEETLVDESHARDSSSRSVGELSHDLGDHGVTEDEYFAGKTFERGDTLPQGDWKAVESGEKLTESGEGGKLFISDSRTSGEWGDMQNKSMESASTDLTEQRPIDEKAASAEYPRERGSLGYQEREQHERLPMEYSGEASVDLDDQTSTDRGIISGKSVETDSLKKGTGEGGYASAEFMEGASLGFDDSRRTDRSEIEGESNLGSNIPTKHVETAVETGDGSSRLLKGPDDEGPGCGDVPARVSEEGSTDRQAIDHRDEQIKSTAFDVDDRMASDHGDHVLTKFGESYESISTESQKDKGTLHPGGDQWTSERGDVATKFIGDASFSMDDDQMATDRAVISSKSVERASSAQKDVEAKEGGNQPEGLVEGTFTVEDQGRKDWGEVPTEGEDGRKTSERGDIPTKFTEGASIRLEDQGKGDWGKVPKVEKHWEAFPKEEEEHWGNVPKEGEYWGGVQKEGEHWGGVPKDGKHWGGVPKEGGHWGTIPREEEHWGDFPKEGEHWENVPKEGEHWGDFPKAGEPWGEVPKEREHWRGVPKEEHWGDFSKQGEHWGGIPEEGEHWRGVPKDGEQWRGVAEEGEHWRGVPKDGEHWRGVPKDAELWRGVAEEGENWRGVPTEGIHWRDVPEAGEHWGGVPKEGGQWADVPKAGEHWGEVPKDGHDGWGEIKREEAFRIRDEQRIAEIHDRYKDTELKYEETWGMSLDRGDDKTKLIEGFDVKQDLPTDHGVTSGRLAEGASFTPADKRALDRGEERTTLSEGFDVEQDLPTDRGVISGNVVEGASFTPADKRALDRGDDKTKQIEGFDVEQDLPTDRGVSSGNVVEGASFTPADKRALDRGDDRTKLSEGFDVEQDLLTDHGVSSGRLAEGASFTPADKRALDRGDDRTKLSEGFDVEQDLPTDRGVSSGRLAEGASFTPADKRALDRGDDRTKLSEGFDVEQDLPTDHGVSSGRLAEGASFTPADKRALDRGDDRTKLSEGFDVEQDLPTDHGVSSGRLAEGASFTPADKRALDRGDDRTKLSEGFDVEQDLPTDHGVSSGRLAEGASFTPADKRALDRGDDRTKLSEGFDVEQDLPTDHGVSSGRLAEGASFTPADKRALDRGDDRTKLSEGFDVEQDLPTDHGVSSGRLAEGASFTPADKRALDRGDDRTKLSEGFDVEQDLPTDHGVSSGRLAEGASFTPADKRALDRGDDRTKLSEGFDVEQDLPTDHGVSSGRLAEGASFTPADKRALDRGDDRTKLSEGFDVEQDLPTDHGVSSGRLAEGASFTPADKRALDRGEERTKLSEGFDVEQDLPTGRGVISSKVVEGASFTPTDKRALDRGDDKTKRIEGVDAEQDLPTDRGISSGNVVEGSSFTPADKRALDRGDDRTKLSEGFDVEQDLPTDRGVISGKVVEGALFIAADDIASESGNVPSKFMEGAYFGLDSQKNVEGGDDQVEEGMGQKNNLEAPDGGSQSHFGKKKDRKDKKKKKKKGSQQPEEAEEETIPQIDPTKERPFPAVEPLPSLDSGSLVSESGKDDAILGTDQLQVSSVSVPAEELQEQKRQRELEEKKRLQELEEQKELERQRHLQELKDQERLQELEELKRKQELEEKHLQELEEQRRLQDLEDQKRLAELEEQKRLKDLEEQKRLKELEEQKRLEALEEQKHLEALEEQKRLEALEQKRLQNIKELQDEKKASCLPLTEQLDQLGQRLAHIRKHPSQPEKSEERMQQLEDLQKDLKELETRLLALKNEWKDVSLDEDGGDDPIFAALSNLQTLKIEARQCSDDLQGRMDERRQKQNELSKITKRFDGIHLWFMTAKASALGKPIHTTSVKFQQEQLCDISNVSEELDSKLQELNDIVDELHSLPDCEDLKAESRLEEKLDALQNDISNLKDSLAERLKNLKKDTEKNEKRQKELQNLEASLVDIQKKVSQMLKSSELPTEDDLEIWKQMPKPGRELQQMLQSEIQEQRELVKTVADEHDTLKAAAPETRTSLPETSTWYTPLPLAVVTREPGSSKVLEAAIQKKVADLRKYWLNMPRDGSAGLDEYQSGQRKFGDVMSTAFQWLDCIEGEAARPTNAAELQDLQRQTKLFRLIYGELLELQKMTGETGRSLKDRLPVSSAQQSALLVQLLEDLDRRLVLLEEEERAKELEAAERKAWQIKLQKQLADVEKEVRDAEQRYLTLSNRQIPCETQLMAAKQLDDDCKESIQRLDGLRTEVELRFIQDSTVSVPPELFSLRHHLIDLHDKVAEKKLDLLRTTNSSVQYATLLEQYAEFLETAQDKVKVTVPSVSDLSQLKDLLSMHKAFFQDLVSHQTLVETIGQKVELHERQRYLTSHARLNNMALGVLDKANAQEMRLKQAVDQWSDVGPQLKEKIAFLESVEKRLPRPTGENDSMEGLEQRIRDLQVVQRELEAEKGSIFQVVESGRQLLKLVACPALTRKLDDFVDRHKKLSDELAEEVKSLEALVKLSKQFDSESDKVEQWMKAADGRKDSIKKMLLAKDVKQAEDGLLELKRDCEDYQSHRTSAITLGNKLLRTRPSDNRVRNKLKLVSDDWLALMIDIADIETRVQDAQRAQLPSRQALSELLQWLLTVQQSVAQDGSTRPRNREDVQQLLKKYKLLKGDLANRQLNIDYVNKVAEQGQGDKQGSHTDQALSAEQLGEMNKQYQGLCSEVNNKTIKLEMVSDAWKEYESTVQSLRDWLDSESIQISREERNLKGTVVDPTLKYCKDAFDALKIKKEKDLESVKRLSSNLVKSSDWPANAESINSNLDALNQHCTLVEDKLSNLQQLASDRKQLLDDYDLALRGVSDVVERTQSSLNKLQQTSGCDITSLNDQIVQLQALQRDFDGSKEVLKKLSGATDALVANLDPASSKVVEDGQKKAADRWQKLKELFSEQLSTLRTLSSKWTSYNEEYNNAVNWLNKKESDIERLLQNDLREDKEGQLKDITAEQKELVAFRGKLLNLESLSKELMPSLDRARVVHIASSQTSLNQHVDSLQQLVDRRLQNFASAEDSREKLIELCQKVEAFLKEATAGLNKASSPYNSSDPEVVEDRLKLVRNLSDEFAQMSPSFTELNHTGYRLPLSKADSDRLKTINDKWQDLHSQTNKQHKKLQQQFLLLQSFADKCKEWNSFLAEVESELTGDIGGNYNSVLQQQQKLEAFQQDIFPHQQILYSIISDGHEMMENSRGTSGAEDFGRKLQLLEEQWQTIVRQANQRKALVDSIVTLWQTYREMTDELSTTVGRVRRFVDSHRVVPETFSSVRHHLDDYTDIRNQLNATKPLVDKLRSYSLLLSPNSDSTTIKQLDLDIKSLDDEAKSLSSIIDSNIKQLGHTLTLWETTQSNLENFVAWLKEIKSFLNPDVPNKYNALVNELEKLENLQSDKSDRCDELTKNLEELTGFITSEDSLILCQRLRLLTQQQSEVSRQLADRRQLVRDRLNRWGEFDKKSDALLAAFANVEQKISNLDALSIEDAIAEIENDLQPEVSSLERRKVELTGLGNELKRNSQDLRASDIEHKIANMNDKCSRLKEILNERLNKLTVALGTLQQLEKRIQDLRWWLLDIEHQLTRPIIYETCSNAEIQHQLKKQLVLQKDIDDHQLPVISVINLCETLSSDKIACPSSVEAQDIRQARDKLESRWKKINVASTERKKVIEETGQLWQKFNTAHQEFTVWLKTIERQVLNPKTGGATFKAMKEQRANIQKLQVDIQTKLSDLDLLNRLYCRLAHDGRTDAKKMLRKKIDDANLRWDNLLARAAAVVKHLSHMISIKEDFEANRLALVIWLSSLNDVLTELEQLDGPPNAKVLNFIRKELANNSARMEYTDRASSYLIQRCEPSDAAQVQRHVDEFHALHEGVLSKLNHLEDRLRMAGGPDAVRENEQHREKIRQLETQLEGSRKNISSSEIQDAVGRLDVNIDDEWNDGLWQATRPDWEEGVGSRITGSYMSPGDESLLVELTSLEEWLVEANATLDSEKRAPQDMAQFDRCLKKHQDLNDQIESWKPRAFRIRSALSPISHHTPFTEGLCDRISAAIADWDRVCLRASDWFPRLQHQLMQSEEFHMSIEDLALWVEDVRVDLDSLDMEKPVDASTPPSVIEAKKKKLAMIDRDLKDIRINLNFIRDIAEYFLQDSPPDAAIEDCDQLDSIADDLEAMQVAYNNHLTMLEAVRGRSFEHSLTGGEGYLSKGSVFPLGTSGRRIPRYAHLSAGKQKQRGKSPKGAADAVTHDDGSYLGLLRRACRTAIPIQLMMLLLIGVASLVPMCENECVFNSLDPLLKYADGAPPL